MEYGLQKNPSTQRPLRAGHKWTCESCEFWDDGYCCVKMHWKQDDDYCDKWSDRYDAESKE